jgi:hypothetical protein
MRLVSGKPTVRKAQSPGGCGMAREANAGCRKAAGNLRACGSAPPPAALGITGRIRDVVPGPERVLTRAR